MDANKKISMSETKIKLLVVDDLEIVCEHLQSYFERRGYVVFTAASAEEALPIIKEKNPDVMLLDVNLPQMSGVELLKLIREFNQQIRVIIVSGFYVDFHNDPELKALNITEVLQKPVDFIELEAVIKKATG